MSLWQVYLYNVSPRARGDQHKTADFTCFSCVSVNLLLHLVTQCILGAGLTTRRTGG